MARSMRIYYLFQDGSVNIACTPTSVCRQIHGFTKKEAESLHVFLSPHEVLAEVREKKTRTLYVRKRALADAGLNSHLYLGTRDRYKVEVVGLETRELGPAILRHLTSSISMMVPTKVAIVGRAADEIYKVVEKAANAGGPTAPLVYKCSVIPTHTTIQLSMYTDAQVLNEVEPSTEPMPHGQSGPIDLRDSAIMRSISLEALEQTNRINGLRPGTPEHKRVQKQLRNKMAREHGFPKFDGTLVSAVHKLQGMMALSALTGKSE